MLRLLTKAFVEEDFEFNGKYMSGQQEIEPRWKRCVKATDQNLGMALGELYVDRTFGPEGKERTLKMVKAIENAMHQDINAVDLDVGHDQEAGLRKAEHHREQHWLSRPMARLQQRHHHVRRLLGRRRAGQPRSR